LGPIPAKICRWISDFTLHKKKREHKAPLKIPKGVKDF